MLKKLGKGRKGFTLIELIVVIAILGILAAIAIPRFAGFTDKAKLADDRQYASLVGNSVVVLMAESKITSAGTVNIANNGALTAAAGGLAGFVANDVYALVAQRALHRTGETMTVAVTLDGAVTITD